MEVLAIWKMHSLKSQFWHKNEKSFSPPNLHAIIQSHVFLYGYHRPQGVEVMLITPSSPLCLQVYVSYDYGTTFTLVSDKFQLSGVKAKDGSKQVISQFYHSPADNRRVSTCSRAMRNYTAEGEVMKMRWNAQ